MLENSGEGRSLMVDSRNPSLKFLDVNEKLGSLEWGSRGGASSLLADQTTCT